MSAKPLEAPGGGPEKRRWPYVLAAVLAALAGVYFLFQNKIVDAQLRPVIERELAKAVNSPVSIQSVRGGLTGNVVLSHVSLTVPGNPWEAQVQVEEVSVRVDLYSLLLHRKPLEKCLESLAFFKPQINLVRKESSSSVMGPPAPASLSGSDSKPPIPLIPIPKLIIKKGDFSIQAEKTPRKILTGLNFDAITENGTIWGLNLQAHSPEKGEEGSLKFNGSLHLETLRVAGKVTLEAWPLATAHNLLKELAGWELQSGTINAESPLVFQPGKGLWYDAKAELAQATLKSPAPASILFSKINGRADIRPTEITIPGETRFNLGETEFKATGVIPFDGRPLSVKAGTTQLMLSSVFAEILKLKNTKVDGAGKAFLAVTGPFSNPVVQASAELGESHVGNWQLDSLAVKAGYDKGVVRLTQAEGKLYDGEFSASGFISPTDEGDAPVSLKAFLKDVGAAKVAAALGLTETEGQINQEIHVGGTLAKPVISANGKMELTRRLGDSKVPYSIQTTLQLVPKKLEFSAVINNRMKLESLSVEGADAWEVQKFNLTTGKKLGHLTGQGRWPKAEEQPVSLRFHGSDLLFSDVPILNEEFPDVTGKVQLDAGVGGTRKSMAVSLQLSSPEVKLADLEPAPMEISISWRPGEMLKFEKCAFGDYFTASGTMGLTPDSSMDLRMDSKGFPVKSIAVMAKWKNMPDPFQGKFTGQARFSGLRKNPILEAKGLLTSLAAGDWYADQTDLLLSLEEGKLQIKKLKLTQGGRSISATGSWDTRSQPGQMSLHINAREFQLGKGPYLSGSYLWEAKTGDPWWGNWTGTFTSPSVILKDLKDKIYHFDDFSMSAVSEDRIIKGKVRIGKNIAGNSTLDLASSPVNIEASLKIEPGPLAQIPELTQFLPPSLRVSGKIAGQVHLKKGPFATLPVEGTFTVTDGRIQKYDFDRMELSFSGNKLKINPSFTLAREQGKYELAGTLESPKAFWDSEGKVTVNGPFKNEKFQNILTLLGVNTEKHKVSGQVDGNLSFTGNLWDPTVGFAVAGKNLRYDDNLVPSADLHFSEFAGKVLLEKNQINLIKGRIDIEKGSAQFDPQDHSVVVMDLTGTTQNIPIASIFDLTSRIHMNGRLALEQKEGRPGFEGMISYQDTRPGMANTAPFDLSVEWSKQKLAFKPLEGNKAQLVGSLDWSQQNKILFQKIHLENAKGSFELDGVLDLVGNSHFTSDAKNIPIQEVGKWLMPKFPLSGTGNYHLIFDGDLDSPIFTTSLTISNGKVGDLQFDLLDGELKSKDNTLYLGSKESPLTLSRKGLFSFTLDGKMPLALNKTGWLKVRDREMDINAQMDKGDFGVILLAGLAEKASGEMDFSAHVGGTLDNPVLTLDLDLNHCQMVPTLVARSIEDISGRIKVRNNKLAVEDLNGRIGQGRVFITSSPVEQSKMNLVNFIPQFLDFQVRTVGDHGVLLSIPTIMKEGEWGEIYFYGDNPNEPMLIRGELTEPHVIGTALLDTGHYTFPPEEAKDKNGEKIEYRQLAGVFFELKLKSGKNTWYQNEFNSQFLELKVDPGDEILIEGKDADRTPLEAGIKCHGDAGAKEGYLRYLGHEFKLEEASLYIPKGKLPHMQGKANDRLREVDVASAGGIRKSDVDIWVVFNGSFGNINFSLDSNPHFSTDKDAAQKILLSYIMFGQDMTGLTSEQTGNYTKEQLQSYYQQKVGEAGLQAGKDFIDRIVSFRATKVLRPIGQQLGNLDLSLKSNLLGTGLGNSGVSQVPLEPGGNTLLGQSSPLLSIEARKYLNPKLSVVTSLGVGKNALTDEVKPVGQVGVGYDVTKNLSVGVTTGQNPYGQFETTGGIQLSQTLPDIMGPKKGDKTPPRFVRFDVYAIGPGKFQLIWGTDKVTRCEVRVTDAGGQLVQVLPEKKEYNYDHKLVVDKLSPDAEYKIQIVAKDLNDNSATTSQAVVPEAAE